MHVNMCVHKAMQQVGEERVTKARQGAIKLHIV